MDLTDFDLAKCMYNYTIPQHNQTKPKYTQSIYPSLRNKVRKQLILNLITKRTLHVSRHRTNGILDIYTIRWVERVKGMERRRRRRRSLLNIAIQEENILP